MTAVTIDPSALDVKIFCDGADAASMLARAREPWVRGFTTNPTLMRQAGVSDYPAFAREVLDVITELPVSFEVLADDPETIERQARLIAGWGRNVYVKVPVCTTKGESLAAVIERLNADGVQVNVTAVFTLAQVEEVAAALSSGTPAVVSVFAGRIADSGRDPIPHMVAAREICRAAGEHIELLWASPRELLNVIQAAEAGVDIITVSEGVLKKLPLLGHDLHDFSLDTVAMFARDAAAAGYSL